MNELDRCYKNVVAWTYMLLTSHIDFVHENVIWTLGGGGGGVGACDVSWWKIVENFDNLLKIFNILKSSIYKVCEILHFRMCIHILSIFVCWLSGSSLAQSVLLNFYTHHSVLKPARLKPSKKVRDVSKGEWGVSRRTSIRRFSWTKSICVRFPKCLYLIYTHDFLKPGWWNLRNVRCIWNVRIGDCMLLVIDGIEVILYISLYACRRNLILVLYKCESSFNLIECNLNNSQQIRRLVLLSIVCLLNVAQHKIHILLLLTLAKCQHSRSYHVLI